MSQEDRGQCDFDSHYGRCNLRGSIGAAGPEGGRWTCPFHYRVRNGEVDHGTRIQNSIEGMRIAIKVEKEQGATRWDKKTPEQWFALASGGVN